MDDLLSDIIDERSENGHSVQQTAPSTMERLEQEKRDQARVFSEDFLANLGASTSKLESRKRAATEGTTDEDQQGVPEKMAARGW